MLKILLIFPLIQSIDVQRECDIRLVLGHNYGSNQLKVIAGRDFTVGEYIEAVPGYVVSNEATRNSIIDDYVMGWNETHSEVIFGTAALYNHAKVRTIGDYADTTEEIDKTSGHIPRALVMVEKEIKKGDEMYFYYGETWFTSRGITELTEEQTAPAAGSFTPLPGCIGAVAELIDERVFAKTKIYAGEVIETTRALLVPEVIADKESIARLVWHKSHELPRDHNTFHASIELQVDETGQPWRPPTTRMVVLPLGFGPFYQSDINYNVEYSWYPIPSSSSSISPTEGDNSNSNTNSSIAELHCGLTMLVSFRVLRDVEVGEELTLNLAVDPDTGHRYAHVDFSLDCFDLF